MDWISIVLYSILAICAVLTVLGSFIGFTIKLSIKPLEQSLNTLKDSVKPIKYIHDFLKENFPNYNNSFYTVNSPRKITEKGYELFKKLDMDNYLNSHCDLLKKEELKNKTAVKVFSECLNWAEKTQKGKDKVMEIRLNTTLLEEQAQELLALAIMEKIKPNNSDN
ncbi:MAG: hypothetical protein OXJ52_04370 [Oligoflexia bacterium]|nr:hypothetical protein [Oligoflexia bacterium]